MGPLDVQLLCPPAWDQKAELGHKGRSLGFIRLVGCTGLASSETQPSVFPKDSLDALNPSSWRSSSAWVLADGERTVAPGHVGLS